MALDGYNLGNYISRSHSFSVDEIERSYRNIFRGFLLLGVRNVCVYLLNSGPIFKDNTSLENCSKRIALFRDFWLVARSAERVHWALAEMEFCVLYKGTRAWCRRNGRDISQNNLHVKVGRPPPHKALQAGQQPKLSRDLQIFKSFFSNPSMRQQDTPLQAHSYAFDTQKREAVGYGRHR